MLDYLKGTLTDRIDESEKTVDARITATEAAQEELAKEVGGVDEKLTKAAEDNAVVNDALVATVTAANTKLKTFVTDELKAAADEQADAAATLKLLATKDECQTKKLAFNREKVACCKAKEVYLVEDKKCGKAVGKFRLNVCSISLNLHWCN